MGCFASLPGSLRRAPGLRRARNRRALRAAASRVQPGAFFACSCSWVESNETPPRQERSRRFGARVGRAGIRGALLERRSDRVVYLFQPGELEALAHVVGNLLEVLAIASRHENAR